MLLFATAAAIASQHILAAVPSAAAVSVLLTTVLVPGPIVSVHATYLRPVASRRMSNPASYCPLAVSVFRLRI